MKCFSTHRITRKNYNIYRLALVLYFFIYNELFCLQPKKAKVISTEAIRRSSRRRKGQGEKAIAVASTITLKDFKVLVREFYFCYLLLLVFFINNFLR